MIGAFKALALRRESVGRKGVPMKIEQDARDKVATLRAMGMEPAAIGLALGIKVDTLKASCADELSHGAEARKAELYLKIWENGIGGNTASAKLALQIGDAARLDKLQRDADRYGRRDAEPEDKAPVLGKKEQKVLDAAAVEQGGQYADLLQPTLLPGERPN